jgi:hypothetical protein
MPLTQKNPGPERIRGPNLSVFIRSGRGAPMEDTLRRADEAGLVIASNRRLSRALYGRFEWRDVIEAFPCRSGTMVAYEKPDKALEKYIRFTDPNTGLNYNFIVPREHRGKKNVALVAEHPDFHIEKDAHDRLILADKVDVVERFPSSREGWFFGDEKHDIPQESRSVNVTGPSGRHMFRMEKGVCMVVRGYDCGYHFQYIDLSGWPSIGFGVAVEATGVTLPGGIEPIIREIRDAAWGAQLSVREEKGRLIIDGTPEQISAAARLLEYWKVK